MIYADKNEILIMSFCSFCEYAFKESYYYLNLIIVFQTYSTMQFFRVDQLLARGLHLLIPSVARR